jgi:Cu/Ag efflux pump CusA
LERRHLQDDYAGAITFGAFLILIAVFYLAIPNLLGEARAFISDFKPVQISQGFWWVEPSTNHPVLYRAVAQFCYVFGLVHVAAFALLFATKSSVRGKARVFSEVIFWLGAGYAVGILEGGTLAWISFLGVLIALAGISILIRSTILVFAFRR